MKKRKLAIIGSTLVLTLCTAVPVFADSTGHVTASSLNLRTGSSTSGDIIAAMANGSEVTVTEKESNGWYKVSWNGQTGYASGKYIDVDDESSVASATNSSQSSSGWSGAVLNKSNGTVQGPSGKETYYNLDMSGVIKIMRAMGNTDEYWVRSDGVKMLGNYIMCAANLSVHPRGSLVETSLGTAIVCDTGGFASSNPNQLDIAVTW
ncbi:MAG: SH3 domain-containing protein [Bilifractor sp.]|jgi:uncharacterized protein YraI